jgi:hypothetical protein
METSCDEGSHRMIELYNSFGRESLRKDARAGPGEGLSCSDVSRADVIWGWYALRQSSKRSWCWSVRRIEAFDPRHQDGGADVYIPMRMEVEGQVGARKTQFGAGVTWCRCRARQPAATSPARFESSLHLATPSFRFFLLRWKKIDQLAIQNYHYRRQGMY